MEQKYIHYKSSFCKKHLKLYKASILKKGCRYLDGLNSLIIMWNEDSFSSCVEKSKNSEITNSQTLSFELSELACNKNLQLNT